MHDTIFMRLPFFGQIAVSGADAQTFLHAQLTSDVMALDHDGAACFACYCTPQGRMLASLHLHRIGRDYFQLTLPRVLCADLVVRLTKYRLRSKVVFAIDESLHCLGWMGKSVIGGQHPPVGPLPSACVGAGEYAHSAASAQPSPTSAASSAGVAAHAMHWDGRTLLCGDVTHIVGMEEALRTAGATQGKESDWLRADMAARWLWVLPETQDLFIPQMAGMEAHGALSFQKGCYPGQEIIARLHYLGKAKRALYRIRSTTLLAAGEALRNVQAPAPSSDAPPDTPSAFFPSPPPTALPSPSAASSTIPATQGTGTLCGTVAQAQAVSSAPGGAEVWEGLAVLAIARAHDSLYSPTGAVQVLR